MTKTITIRVGDELHNIITDYAAQNKITVTAAAGRVTALGAEALTGKTLDNAPEKWGGHRKPTGQRKGLQFKTWGAEWAAGGDVTYPAALDEYERVLQRENVQHTFIRLRDFLFGAGLRYNVYNTMALEGAIRRVK